MCAALVNRGHNIELLNDKEVALATGGIAKQWDYRRLTLHSDCVRVALRP